MIAEVLSVETNDNVNETYSSMQMPKVENKTIVIDDYSTYGDRALSFPPSGGLPSFSRFLCVLQL